MSIEEQHARWLAIDAKAREIQAKKSEAHARPEPPSVPRSGRHWKDSAKLAHIEGELGRLQSAERRWVVENKRTEPPKDVDNLDVKNAKEK
jgi:hypothetical protein